jgi:uncharacterized membrane protein AbrB (regulator of aidB expression)
MVMVMVVVVMVMVGRLDNESITIPVYHTHPLSILRWIAYCLALAVYCSTIFTLLRFPSMIVSLSLLCTESTLIFFLFPFSYKVAWGEDRMFVRCNT